VTDAEVRVQGPRRLLGGQDNPQAADEAITGHCPTSELSGILLLSNGASRIQLGDWPGVLAVLTSSGSADIIDQVRQADAPRGGGRRRDDRTLYRPRRGLTGGSGCSARWPGWSPSGMGGGRRGRPRPDDSQGGAGPAIRS
jgi:hypothetical protein